MNDDVDPWLTADRHRQLFTLIRDDHINGVPASSAPQLRVFAAQMGAGKTVAMRQLAPKHTYVHLATDAFRNIHPAYPQLMATRAHDMPRATNLATGKWLEMAQDYALKHRLNVASETSFQDAGWLIPVLVKFQRAGYTTQVIALAVPRELSLLGTIDRYLAEVTQAGSGRFAPLQVHDDAYHRGAGVLLRIATESPATQILVINRAGEQLFCGRGDPAAAAVLVKAQALTTIERSRLPTRLAEVKSILVKQNTDLTNKHEALRSLTAIEDSTANP
jgi:hypothetical protein